MAAAVPFVVQVVVSVVVSEIATKLASKLGLSDDMAGLVGTVAGVYAGGAAGKAASGASAGGSTAGADLSITGGEVGGDLSIAGQAGGSGINEVGAMTQAPTMSGADLAMSSTVPSTTGAGGLAGMDLAQSGGGTIASQGDAGIIESGGMLNEGAAGIDEIGAGLDMTGVGTTGGGTIDPTGKVGSQLVDTGAYGSGGDDAWSNIFSPGKTADMLMSGIGGYGKAKQAEELAMLPERIREKRAKEWEKSEFGGPMKSLNMGAPSQQPGG